MLEPSSSPALSLDAITSAFGIAPHEVQAFDPAYPDFDAQRPLLVLAEQFETARPLIRRRYPPALGARIVGPGGTSEARVAALPFDTQAWLLPALAPEDDRRSLKGLRRTMELLFGPDGCPWDREQTHETLRPFLLEETYELVDAIDRGDTAGLREEVGDVLAHMFMQGAIAQQNGTFELEDAIEYATEKFVRRHPHVFGEDETDTPEALLGKWEQIKAEERAARGEEAAPEGALDSIPAAAPALQRAQSLVRRAKRAGLGENEHPASGALGAAVATEDWPAALAAVVQLSGDAGVDAEETLRQAAARFTRAFQALEAEALAARVDIGELDAARRQQVWDSLTEADAAL